MTTKFTIRTLVAGRCVELEAQAGETAGSLRARAQLQLQLSAVSSKLWCLGAAVNDDTPASELRSSVLLLLPRAKKKRAAPPAPALGSSLTRRSYVQQPVPSTENQPLPAECEPSGDEPAVLADALADIRSAKAARDAAASADPAAVVAQSLDAAIRSWGDDADANAEAMLSALQEEPAPKRHRASASAPAAPKPAAAAGKPAHAAKTPAAAAWWADAALAALPLPPELATLHREFCSVSAVCAFMRQQRLSATADTAAGVLQLSERATHDRLAAMAAVAPGLVRLRWAARDTDDGERTVLALQVADPARVQDVRCAGTSDEDSRGGAALVQGARSAVSLGAGGAAPRGWDAPSTPAALQLAARQRTAFHACLVHAAAAHQSAAAQDAASASAHAADFDAVAEGAWHPTLPAVTLADALAACASRAAAPTAAEPPAARAGDARRCRDRVPLDSAALLAHLRAGLGSRGQVVHVEELPARTARTAQLPPHATLPAHVREALQRAGTTQLYVHQVAAIAAAAEGRHVAVATSTSSGKSVCYLAPCLAAAAEGGSSLLLFPTKALAQDQLRALLKLLAPPFPEPPVCGVYDGDTPEEERGRLRSCGQILLSNPDMLHCSLLPSHATFALFLSRLRYVVVDEAHAYGGAFGSHTALVLRRLRRASERYGARPRFIFTSATVANPEVHAAQLAGLLPGKVALVSDDGSPCGAKDFVLWQPPLLHAAPDASALPADEEAAPALPPPAQRRGKAAVASALRAACGCDTGAAAADEDEPLSAHDWIAQRRTAQAARLRPKARAAADERDESARASPIYEVALLLAECLQHGRSALAFCKSRKLCELVFSYAQDILQDTAPDMVPALAAYRAGYTPEARRDLERRLFSGELRGVAATNALELGVDVGSLDCVITLGFPGSISSLWQQSGRAGRREQRSLHLYVAFDSPLDRGLFARPAWLFSRVPEAAAVDPSNARVLSAHVACAAFEAPVHEQHDAALFGPGLLAAIHEQRARGRLGRAAPERDGPDGAWAFIGKEAAKGGPARGMNLRCVVRCILLRCIVLQFALGLMLLPAVRWTMTCGRC
jgi:superfamily II DNA helicase RecQ